VQRDVGAAEKELKGVVEEVLVRVASARSSGRWPVARQHRR